MTFRAAFRMGSKHRAACVKGDDLLEKRADLSAVYVDPDSFCIAGYPETVGAAAVCQSDLSGLRQIRSAVSFDFHGTFADVVQQKVFMTFQFSHIAGIKEMLMVIAVIMAAAGQIEKKLLRQGRRRGKITFRLG